MSLLEISRSISDSKRTSARLDLLSLMIGSSDVNAQIMESPRESFSPFGDDTADQHECAIDERGRGRNRSAVELARCNTKDAEAGSRAVQETRQDSAFHEFDEGHEASITEASTIACSPRSSPLIRREHRPADLTLTKTNGSTSLPIDDLKRQISNGHTNKPSAITHQVSQREPKRPQHSSPQPKMGNQPSSVSSSPVPDNASTHSVIRRKPVRMLRKSSQNLFKRMDSKSPLPKELTAGTVLQVTQAVSQSTFDGQDDEENDESKVDPFNNNNAVSSKTSHPPIMPPPIHSASTITITEEVAMRPQSASTTIRDNTSHSRRESRVETRKSFVENLDEVTEERSRCATAPPLHRGLTLSPSIPAPSPLPEDSPHKYGLKDRMDTPDIPEPEKIEVVKARRKSTGFDIFNEAKSLQSASSFLNGLSTSRRRAETKTRSTEASACTYTSYETTRPSSSRRQPHPSSTRPPSGNYSNTFSSERRRGHTFKPSGFAYTRPLTLAQMKCYRDHQRLLPSRNKNVPVECSVCHIDDDQQHYSCSWCALRMCRFCRRDFAERGLAALKDRIKQAELGNSGNSPASSTESLGGTGGRGRKMCG